MLRHRNGNLGPSKRLGSRPSVAWPNLHSELGTIQICEITRMKCEKECRRAGKSEEGTMRSFLRLKRTSDGRIRVVTTQSCQAGQASESQPS